MSKFANILTRIDLTKTDHVKCFGHSMYPLILDGNVVYYRKKPFRSIKINDIIVTKNKKYYTTHRVIYKSKTYIITKGDNNVATDPRVKPSNIIGTVYKIVRNGKKIHPDTIYLMQSTLYFKEINKFLDELNKNNIRYVLLKGLFLHLIFTKEHPRRRYLDYDVLVSYSDYKMVHSILHKLNYTIKEDYLTPLHKKIIDKPIEFTYVKEHKPFPITADIHFEPVFMMTQIGTLSQLYPQNYIDKLSEQFLDNARTVNLYNHKYNILSLSNFILYLSLHFFHHNYKGIFRLELLDSVIRSIPEKQRSNMWSNLASDIYKYKLCNYTYGSFVICKKYLSTPIPQTFLTNIEPSKKHKKYIQPFLRFKSLFYGTDRITEGIQLFKNLYCLSYRPITTKLLVFTKPPVLFTMYWIGYLYVSRRIYKMLKFNTLKS